MFPEAFASKWIETLTRPDDVILDPFCGRGTAPFQALLMDRRAIGVDTNPVAFCITKAKTNAPAFSHLQSRVTQLERAYDPQASPARASGLPEFFEHAFHPVTLSQVLYLRSRLDWRGSGVDCMITAIILGSLHGELDSPYYLSNQMPRTISTKPDYSVRFWQSRGYRAPRRDAFEVIRNRASYRYVSARPEKQAAVLNLDMRELPRHVDSLPQPIRCAITSPPYLDMTSYEEDQWLRLWFVGGEPRPRQRQYSRDDRLSGATAYWRFITDMWRSLSLVLAPRADVVIRIGAKGMKPRALVDAMHASSTVSHRKVTLASHAVSQLVKRQTNAFRPGTRGCSFEVDCHFVMA